MITSEDIVALLEDKYIEHIEDRGVSPEEILVTLLVKAYLEIDELKKKVSEK